MYMLSLVHIAREVFFFSWESAFCVYCGRADIVNAGSWETRYSECRVRETRYSECRVLGDQI
ncbi:unnamed protein product [Staurois parvus]|uniref:Secreted protein n=1 Tax=Staurois parvus TaxID=386267 RepID=A0ABN9HQF2_9NEOB|nr:unnamed protein product [Staurois parvus]